MKPTLLVGDYIVVGMNYYKKNDPKRNDLVVFVYPLDPSKDYIKRVIGLPGDRLQIVDKKVFINGTLCEIPQAVHTNPRIQPAPVQAGDSPRDNFGPLVVPADSYFVLGDNRDFSYDSRFWGVVPRANLLGKALYIYYSKDKQTSSVRWDRIGKTIE